MQAVILAAGRGKRMGNLTKATTKPMLNVNGRPLLEYKIEALPKKIKEVVFVVGYHSLHIISHFKHYYAGKKITYIFQNNLNGTGGALHLAKSVLGDKFMVVMGDDLYHKKDLAEIVKYDLAILGYKVNDPCNFGVIKANKKKQMLDVIEKPKNLKSGLANAGVYVLNKKFFDYDLVPIGNGEFGLPQTMAKMAKDYEINIVKATDWHPIGKPEDLEKAKKILHKFI